MTVTYPIDATAGTEAAAAVDLLNRGSFLATTERAIDGLSLPATIGLFGEWGSGKTTLLNLIEARFAERRVVVRFDPWYHDGEPSPLPALVAALRLRLVQLDPTTFEKTHWEALAELALAATPTLVKAFTAAGALASGGIAAPLTTAVAKTVGVLKDWFRKRNREEPGALDQLPAVDVLRHGLAAAFQTVADAARARGHGAGGVLVLIDDLDRCLPEAMLVLLNSLRVLFRCQDGLPATFVCAVDRHQLVHVLRTHYSRMDSVEAERYLEKIFDASLWIPEITGAAGLEHLTGYLRQRLGVPAGSPPTAAGACVLRLFEGEQALDGLVRRCLRYNLFANPRLLHRVAVRITMTAEAWETLDASERRLWQESGLHDAAGFTAMGLALLAISVYDPGFRPNLLHRPQLWEPLAELIAGGPAAQLEHESSELTRTARDLGLLEVLANLVGVRLDQETAQLTGLERLRAASEVLRSHGL